MKKYYLIGALLLASGSAAFAADPQTAASTLAACCDLVLGCCQSVMDCCP